MPRPFRFAPPALGPRTVSRRRLLSVLADRWEHRLLTIEAGGGFGKTTLLSQALAENTLDPRGRDVWLTAEPADASASTLLSALLAALDRLDPDQLPTVETVADAVWDAAPEPVCLVIDDAHAIAPDSGGRDALNELVRALPENGHLLVAARPGGAPQATRLMAQARALAMDENDLRLDDAEIAELAAAHDVHASVLQESGGWPALAVLWATAGRAGAQRFASEEVLGGLTDADRTAFLLTVAVGGGEADVIEAAAGGPVDTAALADVPLVAVAEGSVRPHALWEQLLEAELEAVDVTAARQRAAGALRARGEPARAFELLASAGDWDEALLALFDACNDQRQPPWRDAMERWRALVPAELAERPEVAYLDGLIEREADPWSNYCGERFGAALKGFEARGDIQREFAAGLRAGFADWLRGDVTRLEARYERLQVFDAGGIPMDLFAPMNAALRADIVANYEAMVAMPDLPPESQPRLRHLPAVFRVFARVSMGGADRAAPDAETAATLGIPVWPAAGTGFAAMAPALVAWVRGEVASATLDELEDPGPRLGVAERAASVGLAAVAAAHRGQDAAAVDHLTQLRALAPPGQRRAFVAALTAAAAATIAAARGDSDGAAQAFIDELGDAPLEPVGALRPLLWFPAISWLYCPRARPAIEATAAAAVIEACRALEAARNGGRVGTPAILDRPDAVLAALPATHATELAVHALAAGDDRPTSVIRRAIDFDPRAVRATLHRLVDEGRPEVARGATALLGSTSIPPEFSLRIEVLGPTRLLRDGVPVDTADWRRERVRHLLLALVVHREIRRERLGVLVWPDFDEDALSANLRTTLTYLQRLLEPERGRGDAPWFVRQHSGALVLAGAESLDVDLWEFEAALDAAAEAAERRLPSVELEHLERAVALWRGDPLEDLAFVDWAAPHRDRARARLVDAAVRASALLTNSGRAGESARVASVAVDADPTCEAAYRALAAAQLAGGHGQAAAATLEQCGVALAELGFEPGPETLALKARLAAR